MRLVERELVAPDVVRLLVAPESGPLAPAPPGSHLDIAAGPDGLVRQYSVCDSDVSGGYELGVRLDIASRGGSAAMHALSVGDLVTVGAPRNTFPLGAHDGPVLLLAAGIGITPLLSMARDLARRGAHFDLHHVVRDPARSPFRRQVAAVDPGGHVHLHRGADRAGTGKRLLEALAARPQAVYICGPAAWMLDVAAAATRLGLPTPVTEAFTAAPLDTESAFTVTLASTGQEVVVGAGESALNALARAGVVVDSSCETGVCGTCLTGVLAGRLDHRDQFLTVEEQDKQDRMCLCVSRGRGPLVLDL